MFADGAGGVLVFDARTGVLNYESDVYRNHDGTPTDGAGNIITLNITASDGTNSSSSNTDTDAQTAAVNLRINVAPTDIWFAASTATNPDTDSTDGAVTVGTATTFVVTVSEHVGRDAAADPAGDLIAHVDVQDENSGMHEFGTHDVTLSGDDRFMITHTGYTGRRDSEDVGREGSTWEVRLKPGEKIDFETQVDMDLITPGKQIVLTLTATDGGGLSTPSGAGTSPITLTITITDIDADGTDDDLTTVDDNDLNHPAAPTPNDVPGLEDDETTTPGSGTTEDNTSETVDDNTDDDTDGGSHPPPPGMSLGGIIEDFIDNMDQGEQDLLEDFLLTIDDGLDIL